MDLRGVTQRRFLRMKSFSWESFSGAKTGFKYAHAVSDFDFVARLISQMLATVVLEEVQL